MIAMLRHGTGALWRHKWELIMIYLLHLLFGIVVGGKLRAAMTTALDQSIAGRELASGYDSDVMADMMRHHSLDVGGVAQSSLVLIPIFVLLSIWLYGGLTANMATTQRGVYAMVTKGCRHYPRLLMVSLCSLALCLLIGAVLWVPFLLLSGMPPLPAVLETYHSEKQFFLTTAAIIALTYLCYILVSSWAILAKALLTSGHRGYYKKAALLVSTYLWQLLFYGIIMAAVLAVLVWLLSLLRNTAAEHTVIYILLGQCIVITLCKLRVCYIGGVVSLANRTR